MMSLENLRKVFQIFQTHWKRSGLLFALIFITAFTEAIGLSIIVPLIGMIIGTDSVPASFSKYLYPSLNSIGITLNLTWVLILFFSLFLIKNILNVAKIALKEHLLLLYQLEWGSGLLDRYLHLPYPKILKTRQGEMLNNVIAEPRKAGKCVNFFLDYVTGLVLALVFYGLLLMSSWQITLMLTGFLGVAGFIFMKASDRFSLTNGEESISLGQSSTVVVNESITGIRHVKTYGLEEFLSTKFRALIRKGLDLNFKFAIFAGLPKPMVEMLVISGIVAFFAYYQRYGEQKLADLVPTIGLFVLVSNRIIETITEIMSKRMKILSHLPSFDLIHALSTNRREDEEVNRGEATIKFDREIIFENVSFSYDPGKPVLQKIDFKIKKGELTLLVGKSGSGKSTCVDLLFGLIEPSSGRILIDQTELKHYRKSAWRNFIGYVSQDTFLFNGSIRENLLLAKPDATESELKTAIDLSFVSEFVDRLSDGINTQLGDRGLTLSGGQRQRLSIARAILKNPEIFIFDEATSALDKESENMIQASMERLLGTKTMIVISHQASFVQKPNQLIVLDQGKVLPQATQRVAAPLSSS